MTTDYALNFIKNELKFLAKQVIIDKFSVLDKDITNDFEYYEDGELKYRHTFSAITDSIIVDNLYASMLNICVSQCPIHLLVKKGESSENIIRNYNDDYDIRKPNELVLGEDMDIDEPLALASVYDTLNFFGATAFSQKAKNILTEYERNLVVPNAKYISDLAFRFSSDGNAWHSNYENGDNYFGIYSNGSWGNAIPLISGSGGGAKTLTALSDFPNTHENGKYLRSNGSKLEWVDIDLSNIGSGGSGGNSGSGSSGSATPLVPLNIEYDNANGIDLRNGIFYYVTLNQDSVFKVAADSMYNLLISDNIEYKILVDTKYNELNFDNNIATLTTSGNLSPIDTHEFVMFNLIKVGDNVFAYNITQGSF